MKERRKAGATHSFRLSRKAAKIVDEITYPRRLGGKSRKVSEAIELWFENSKNPEKVPLPPAWWRRFWPLKR